MRLYWTVTIALALPALAACGDNGSGNSATETTGGSTDGSGGTEPTTGEPENCEGIMVPAIDESACMPLATDYTPRTNNSADDMWPACVADTGPYMTIMGTPGAQARIEAYEKMADLLWRKSNPTPEDFTAARDQYVIPEGLESRLSRREDLHVDAIPLADQDSQVDSDKQCTVGDNVMKYPDRCIGPSTIHPLVDAAFQKGQNGEGDPDVNAATIHGALDWFIYLSSYKEAESCVTFAAEDCDASWAYYTGGVSIDGGIGLAAEVRAQSVTTHERIHDGIMAVRCWRDLSMDDMGGYPLLDTFPQDMKDLFALGWEQLDQGLNRGLAVAIRGQMEAYVNAACDGKARAHLWAYVQNAAPPIANEAERRDATKAKALTDVLAMDAPTAADVAPAIAALDELFPCP